MQWDFFGARNVFKLVLAGSVFCEKDTHEDSHQGCNILESFDKNEKYVFNDRRPHLLNTLSSLSLRPLPDPVPKAPNPPEVEPSAEPASLDPVRKAMCASISFLATCDKKVGGNPSNMAVLYGLCDLAIKSLGGIFILFSSEEVSLFCQCLPLHSLGVRWLQRLVPCPLMGWLCRSWSVAGSSWWWPPWAQPPARPPCRAPEPVPWSARAGWLPDDRTPAWSSHWIYEKHGSERHKQIIRLHFSAHQVWSLIQFYWHHQSKIPVKVFFHNTQSRLTSVVDGPSAAPSSTHPTMSLYLWISGSYVRGEVEGTWRVPFQLKMPLQMSSLIDMTWHDPIDKSMRLFKKQSKENWVSGPTLYIMRHLSFKYLREVVCGWEDFPFRQSHVLLPPGYHENRLLTPNRGLDVSVGLCT